MNPACPVCGKHDVVVTDNPPRFTLPKLHGSCQACGHEWNFNPYPASDRRLGL